MKNKNIYFSFFFSLFCFVSLILIPNLDAHAYKYTAKDWKNWDIRTEFKGTTVDDVKAHLKSKGKTMQLAEIYPAYVDAGKKNGINPDLMYAMSVMETSWGTSSLAKNYNNYGGIMCKSGYECVYSGDRKWTVFKSPDEYARVKAELLAGKIYVGAGKTTIDKMINTYAPGFENNLYGSGGYISVIGQVLESLGYTPDGTDGTMSAEGGTYKDTESTKGTTDENREVSSYTPFEPFEIDAEGYMKVGNTGVDNSSFLPKEMAYYLTVLSDKAVTILTWIGVLLSIILIMYIAIVLIFYVAILRGQSFNVDFLDKMINLEDDNVYSRKTLFKIMFRGFSCLLIVAIFLSSTHIVLMGFLYEKLQELIMFIGL